MVGIDVTEAAAIGARLHERWPNSYLRRVSEDGPHEVRTVQGELIATHDDIGECLRIADRLAAEKGGA